ncbi:hypothetical protein ACQPU1_04980 [Clostridium paraputrificum]|uniref:hypothetical protein n=1 Tax=Clostridium TaxID=1485 RepID=UPI003D338B14
MKNKICLILVFLFSFINLGAIPQKELVNSFISIESEIKGYSNFLESGVKVEYKSNLKKEKEFEKLKDNIISFYKNEDIIAKDDNIQVNKILKKININIYEENDKTQVEITLINYDSEKSLSKLMKELTKLQTNNAIEVRYFKYVKGRINNTEEALEAIKNTSYLKDIETLDIHNGNVGTAILYDGERVNFVISSYDTGSYLIIGTPIIFTTY